MKHILSVSLSVLFLLCAGLPAANAMRCRNGLVTDNSTKLEVLDACGEPMKKFGDDVTIGDTGVTVGEDEKWVYDIGGGVYHVIYFDEFKVRKIEIQQK
ncbi:MAG: DUF2845 domain-containing protein [Desulfosarcina sp.]